MGMDSLYSRSSLLELDGARICAVAFNPPARRARRGWRPSPERPQTRSAPYDRQDRRSTGILAVAIPACPNSSPAATSSPTPSSRGAVQGGASSRVLSLPLPPWCHRWPARGSRVWGERSKLLWNRDPTYEDVLLARAQLALDGLAARVEERAGATWTDAGWCAADAAVLTTVQWIAR
jgi:hypothetical protein